MTNVCLITVFVSSLLTGANPAVQEEVNRFLDADRAGDRAAVLRRLAGIPVSEVEAALRNGTAAKPAAKADTLLVRKLSTVVGKREFESIVYLPRGYTPQKRYRLLIALQGTGGNGAGYIKVWLPWIRKRADTILAVPTIVGEPWGGSRAAHSHVHTLLGDLVRNFSVDDNQVWMGGMSMGGHAAFRIGCFRADRFAGLICRVHGPAFEPPPGKAAAKDGSNLVPRFLENLNNTPLYWIVGKSDPGISIDLMRRGNDRLRQLKYDVTFREMDGGHQPFLVENDGILNWMDGKARNPYLQQVVLHTNCPDHTRLWWVQIKQFDARDGPHARFPWKAGRQP